MQIIHAVDLSRANTFGFAAQALRALVLDDAADCEALPALLGDGAYCILGGGSNCLLPPMFNGTVVQPQLRGIRELSDEKHGSSDANTVVIEAAAGEPWHSFVDHCLQRGWYGIENLALIPGTVGAAPVQNIGAYGVELTQVFDSLTAYDLQQRSWRTFDKAACEFGYRDSVFKRNPNRYVITALRLRLSRKPKVNAAYKDVQHYFAQHTITAPTPQDVFNAVVAIRRAKLPDPAVEGNAGSFFKNPVLAKAAAAALLDSHPAAPHYPQPDGSAKFAAAWLIDACGFKGVRRGAVGVHPQHALVLVNYGGAKREELLALSSEIQAAVRAKFGVALEPEPMTV